MNRKDYSHLKQREQDLIEALERAGKGRRRALAEKSALELELPPQLLPSSHSKQAMHEWLAFRSPTHHDGSALVRARRGSKVHWLEVHHHRGVARSVSLIEKLPSFMTAAECDELDGGDDHARSAAVREQLRIEQRLGAQSA